MDKEGASMDVNLEGWEVLPDHKSSFFVESSTAHGHGHGHGHNFLDDQEAKKPLPPSEHAGVDEPVTEFKDIAVVRPPPPPSVTEPLIPDGEEEEEVVVQVDPYQFGEEEGVKKDRTQSKCMGFSVWKLRVNGIGALCSFGVAAATLCICLISGRLQHQQKLLQQQQKQKIQLQIYGDDKRIQQVVQQTSRLNQAMSSVMGGASTRANISFGGYYDGF